VGHEEGVRKAAATLPPFLSRWKRTEGDSSFDYRCSLNATKKKEERESVYARRQKGDIERENQQRQLVSSGQSRLYRELDECKKE
jgi:hypothetical protein